MRVALSLILLLSLSLPALSEESSANHGTASQQITVPANSSNPTIININTAKHAGQENQCTQPKDWKQWFAFIGCNATAWLDAERVIAIFTVILGIATWLLWRATRALVIEGRQSSKKLLCNAEAQRNLSEDTARRQLRAYIGIESVCITSVNDLLASGDCEVRVVYRNFGETPAFKVTATGIVTVTDATRPTLPLYGPGRASSYLPPTTGGEHFMRRAPPLNPIQIAGLQNGTLLLVAFGRIDYKDIFGDDRWVTFQFQMGGRSGIRSDGRMTLSPNDIAPDGNNGN